MSDEKKKENQYRTILLFVLVSLLIIHLPIFLGLYFYFLHKNFAIVPPSEPKQQVVWVKPEMPPPTQIADIERPLQEKKPEKAKFAGQYDSAVKQETVARPKPKPKVIQENPLSSDTPPKKVAQRPRPPKPTPEPKVESPMPEEMTPPKPVAEKKEEKKEEPKKEPKPDEVEIAEKTPLEKLKKKEEEKKEKPEEEKPEAKKPVDLALKPHDVLRKQKQTEVKTAEKKPLDLKVGPGLEYGRPSAPDLFRHDYFPDYKVGGKTYLNVMKLQDIGYFVKMKRILKMRWNPVPSVRDYVYANRISIGRIECVLGVALDDSGKIAEMFVIRSSGLGAYDQEAMQTFRDSSPFSTPPSDYIKDGRLRMSWTFTVYL